MAQKLYENYADLQEGKLTRLRASLVSRGFLNDLGLTIGLSRAVKLGKGESTENNSIVGNALEAVEGAILLDAGLEDTKKLLDNGISNFKFFIGIITNIKLFYSS